MLSLRCSCWLLGDCWEVSQTSQRSSTRRAARRPHVDAPTTKAESGRRIGCRYVVQKRSSRKPITPQLAINHFYD